MSRIKPACALQRTQPTRTLLHLTLETEAPDVLDRIRAALPAGCRMEVRIAAAATHPDAAPDRSMAGCADTSGFTDRQRQVMALLLDGLSNKEIGRRLALSHFTVRNHVSQSLKLLNVPSRKAAIARLAGGAVGPDGPLPRHTAGIDPHRQ